MIRKKETDFIVIDDDYINNIICEKVIRSGFPEAKVVVFTNAQKGLKYMSAHYGNPDTNNVLLLLDINMPGLDGWEILEQLTDAPIEVRAHLEIYMLSSSVTPDDKIKAANDPMVAGYIEKPLTLAKLPEKFSGSGKTE